MTKAIRFYTRSGNTEKLAKAISEELGVEATSIEKPLSEKVDVLFLGCSYYAFDMDEHVKTFLRDNKEKIGSIACFGTSAMMKSMIKPLSKVTGELGINVLDNEFHCRGKFGAMHKDRPNESDLIDAKKFAKSVIG